MNFRCILFVFALCTSLVGYAQKVNKSTFEPEQLPSVILIEPYIGVTVPSGDMSDLYHTNMNFGGNISFLSSKNWILGAEASVMFSPSVKGDVLAPLRTSNGYIINQVGQLSEPLQSQMGLYIGGHVGKLFPIAANKRSAIEVKLGAGHMENWVRIRVIDKELIQLDEEYRRGYDRRTAGFALRQHVGYRYMSPKRFINVFIGLDFMQGFTQSVRPINYDTRQVDTKSNLDLLLGVKAGFTVPLYIYSKESDGVEFY